MDLLSLEFWTANPTIFIAANVVVGLMAGMASGYLRWIWDYRNAETILCNHLLTVRRLDRLERTRRDLEAELANRRTPTIQVYTEQENETATAHEVA